jgi:hypothetical protein
MSAHSCSHDSHTTTTTTTTTTFKTHTHPGRYPHAYTYTHSQTVVGQEKLSEMTDIHGILGGVIGFVVAFRLNNSYMTYNEGRRLVGQLMNGLREVVLDCYSALPPTQPTKGGDRDEDEGANDTLTLRITPPDSSIATATASVPATEKQQAAAAAAYGSSSGDDDALLESAREVRRLCNVLFAFVRQDVREAQHGFLPGSDLEHVGFDARKVWVCVNRMGGVCVCVCVCVFWGGLGRSIDRQIDLTNPF